MNRFKHNSSDFIRYRKTKSFFNFFDNKKRLKKIWLYIIIGFSWFILLATIIIYVKYILPLPDVKNLEKLNLAKSSIIYDRDWNELYKIYKENRTYVNYENISKNIINALVAWEDKTFLKNSWVDFKRMLWAFIYYALWKTDKVEWTSTITQQLIRNTLIWNERKIERKIKEIYLSYKLSSSLSKEKILELYLNKIEFWSNSYGIEQASKTFFGKSAKDLEVLEGSILASLPKWPSYYSPYTHADRLLGYVYIYDKKEPANQMKILNEKDKLTYANDINPFLKYIDNLKSKKISNSTNLICWINKNYHKKNSFIIDKDWCSLFDYSKLLEFLNSIQIENWWKIIEYQTWRKDFILQRMLEDNYINFDDYKNSVILSIWFKFEKNKERIKAAHFVLYIKEYLEKKYGKEFMDLGWLKIYTTIDSNLQNKAEELIEKYGATNAKRFWANNDALISIDNTTGDIIAMVWWRDYFNVENWWNVNMITSRLQPWSSFKPIVYANAINQNSIWSKTPIFDLQTNFPWWYTPSNFDWKFNWLMNISTALNNSRNIPAIKMVYLWWWENKVVELAKKLWFYNIADDWRYGASIWLWTVEVTPLEMAKAYTVFANLWEKKEVSPIVKILDSKWVIIEEKIKTTKKEQVLDSATAYIMNSILSDTSSRPAWWNAFVSLSGRKVAAKTGTSTKQYEKNGKKIKLPRNLWTIWYTPQITTVVWVWNTDWKEVNMSWDWLNAAWPIWRDFMTYAHKDKKVLDWKMPAWVKTMTISKLTWNATEEWFREDLTNVSMFKNLPIWKWTWLWIIKVDALCNWKISELTPEAWIKEIYTIDIHSLLPENKAWDWPIQEWIKNWKYKETLWELVDSDDIIQNTICKREENPIIWNVQIVSKINTNSQLLTWINYIELAYRSDSPIIKIDILLDDIKIDEISLPWKKEWSYKWNFKIPDNYKWVYDITIRAVNNEYYSSDETKEIEIVDQDNIPPTIIIKNPIDKSIKLHNSWEEFNLRWEINDNGNLKSINIYIDEKTLKLWLTDRSFVFPISWENLEIWTHTITVEAIDNSENKSSEDINLEIIN